jgi:hypothetical protein
MQGMGVAVKMGVTKSQLDSTVGIHPSGEPRMLQWAIHLFSKCLLALGLKLSLVPLPAAAEEFVTMRTPTRQLRKETAAVAA